MPKSLNQLKRDEDDNLDWDDVLKCSMHQKYRHVLEVIHENGNKPTPMEKIREKVPEFSSGWRDRINDKFRQGKKPYFVINSNSYGRFRNICLQVVHR